MFATIFTKTLYQKRWMMFWWFLAIAVSALLVVALFPTFKESFGESLRDVPESLRGLLGNAQDYQTLAPYIDLQVINQLVIMTVVLGVFAGVSLLAGDEGEGTLQTLLAQPVSRWQVYLQKFAAAMVVVASACAGLFIGSMVGAGLVGESLDIGRMFLASAATWLVTMVFTALAFAVGAATGRRGLAGAVAGGIAFAAYLVTNLAASVDALSGLDRLSPFHYFNRPSILQGVGQWGDVLVLAVLTLVFAIAGWVWFRGRDVAQR